MDEQEGVEHLKGELYSRTHKNKGQDIRSPLSRADQEAPKHWPSSAKATDGQGGVAHPTLKVPKEHMAFATKFLIGSAVFFCIALLGAALFFFSGSNFISAQNIELQVVAPALVDGGTTVNIQYLITNRNSVELQLADLLIEYPQSTRDPKDPTKTLLHERISVGTLAPGRQVKLTSSAVLYGTEGSTEAINASLHYSVPGSNATFAKEGSATITIGSAPVSVRVEAPQEAIAGQPLTLTITVQSNSTTPVQDVVIKGQYPFGFSVKNTSPRAEAGGTLWRLGTMAPGASQTITVVGSVDGQDGDERVFKFLIGTSKDQTGSTVQVPFLSVPTSLTVRRPFITGAISVNGKTGDKVSASAGAPLQGSIAWQNNLGEGVSDIQLRLTIAGPSLDRSSVQAGSGFYQSSDTSITWTSAQDPSLAQVPPGGTGAVNFSFATLPPGAGGVVYQNPTITLTLSVSAVRSGESGVPETVQSAATTQVTLASAVALSAAASHFTGAYQNSGPMPPRAETPTTYTVKWTAKNSSNAVANATVSAVLPPYVTFVAGQSGINYEPASRTVKWDMGDLGAGVGYSGAARAASFQITLTPSSSQVGQAPPLTGQAQLSGTDRFAQVQVSAVAEAPTTRLSEAGFAQGMELVAPK